MFRTKTGLTSIAMAFALLGSACGAASTQDETTRDEIGNVVEGGEVGVFALRVGDCFTDIPVGEVETIEAVPCAGDHLVEVYHTFDVDLPAFDSAKVNELAGEGCFDAFEPYVGSDYASSYFDFTSLNPTSESWEFGDDREIVCLLRPFEDGETTAGTAKGSALTLEVPDAGDDDAGGDEGALGLVSFVGQVGDCYENLPDGGRAGSAISCEGEHRVEVYHAFDLELSTFEAETVSTQAADGCLEAFDPFVGVEYAASIYDAFPIQPTEMSWEQDDREVLCLLTLYASDEPTVGSAADTGQ